MNETAKIQPPTSRSNERRVPGRPRHLFGLRSLSTAAAAETIALAFSAQTVAAKPKYCATVIEGSNVGTGTDVRLLDGLKGEVLVTERLAKDGQQLIVDAPSEDGKTGHNLDISTVKGTLRLQQVQCVDRNNPGVIIRIDFSALPRIISQARVDLTQTATATRTFTPTATRTPSPTPTRTLVPSPTSSPTRAAIATPTTRPNATSTVPGFIPDRDRLAGDATRISSTATAFATNTTGELGRKAGDISKLTAQNYELRTAVGEYAEITNDLRGLTAAQFGIIAVENAALLAVLFGRSAWQIVQTARSRRGRTMHSERISQALDTLVGETTVVIRQPRGRNRIDFGGTLSALREKIHFSNPFQKSGPEPRREGPSDLERRAAFAAREIAGQDGDESEGTGYKIDLEAAAADAASQDNSGPALTGSSEDPSTRSARGRSPRTGSEDLGGF